jgi:lipoyl(octanoyl) transferase
MQSYWLGRIDYPLAEELQRELVSLRTLDRIGDILLLLEHPPTITLGRGADHRHLLAAPTMLSHLGIRVISTDRGGDITYHGPGQLVGYPIVKLEGAYRDIHQYLRRLEEALITLLAEHQIAASRFPPHTGVWVQQAKIAAIGVKVSRWVCSHGFALNVNPDMTHFETIVPCGIRNYGVTSLHQLKVTSVTVEDLCTGAASALRSALGPTVSFGSPVSILSEALHPVWQRAVSLDNQLSV